MAVVPNFLVIMEYDNFFKRKKIINTITVNMLYAISGVSPAIIFRVINDRDFLQRLAQLIKEFEPRHRRKQKPAKY